MYHRRTSILLFSFGSLLQNNTGSFNSAIGIFQEMPDRSNNTSLGYQSGLNALGSGNVLLDIKQGFNETRAVNSISVLTNNPLMVGDFSTER